MHNAPIVVPLAIGAFIFTFTESTVMCTFYSSCLWISVECRPGSGHYLWSSEHYTCVAIVITIS